MELAGEGWVKVAQASVVSARSKAIAEELESIMSNLASLCVECTNSCWSAHSVVEGSSKVEDDVSNVVMAVSGEVADATKRNLSIIGLKLKDTLKQLSTQIEI